MKINLKKSIVWVLFLVYLLLLFRVILLKYGFTYSLYLMKNHGSIPLDERIRHSNFLPMKTIFYYLFQHDNFRVSIENLVGNLIAFAPLGFLLPFLSPKIKKFKNIFYASLILSLFFEITQLLTGLGSFDVDDLILNVLGAILGLYLYYLFEKILNRIQEGPKKAFKVETDSDKAL